MDHPLIVLSIIHTLGFQLYNERDGRFLWALAALTLIVGLAQGAGVVVHRSRARGRAATQVRPVTSRRVAPERLDRSPESKPALGQGTMSRRRFLVLGGTTVLGAAAAAVSFKVAEQVLKPTGSGPTSYDPSTSATNATSATPAASNLAVPSPTPQTAAGDISAPQAAIAADPTSAPPTSAPTPGSANPTPTDSSAPAPAGPATSTGGVVLTTLAACPVNSAVIFTAPDTGETGILVHETDGTVKAFSNVCTHRPYPVEYDANSQILVCPLHYACFDASTGGVTQGPARRALAPMPVHVGGQGNVVYG